MRQREQLVSKKNRAIVGWRQNSEGTKYRDGQWKLKGALLQ